MAGKKTLGNDIPTEPSARREWFRTKLGEHMNTETGKPWTQADVARKAGCSEGHVSLVFSGSRTTGEVTRQVQRVTAKALNSSNDELFGHVCTSCTRCGTKHAPKRLKAAVA